MSRVYFLLAFVLVYLLLDFYVFQVVRQLTSESPNFWRRFWTLFYWGTTLGALLGIMLYNMLDPELFKGFRIFLLCFFFTGLLTKVFVALVLGADDLRRGITWIFRHFTSTDSVVLHSRSDFIAKSALVVGAIPLTTLTFGILSGAHDYRVRKRTLLLPNLPKAFDGIRLAQISDIHTGSFYNKTAVKGGVEMVNAQKPDLICFTGDLVNYESREAKPYLDIFKKLAAPLGVYSIMGNHDYGDYRSWQSMKEKQRDIATLHQMHGYMGWHIMLNKHQLIRVDGESIGLLGCENWGKGRFSKYGNMVATCRGTEDVPFKMLMSHDPSHWDAQIRPEYPDIDLTLSGHTHGMQFGVEFGNFRWSPVKLFYKQWADLYQEGTQYLYVNRGFGYIGYPGRIGILPEITILELKKA